MDLDRRQFLQTSAAVAGVAALSDYALGGPASTAVKKALGSETPDKTGEKWVPTTCWIGKQDCGMLARVVDGRLVKVEGHPDHPRNRGTLCPKGLAQPMFLYDPYRVKAPLKRTNEKGVPGEWQEISWDEALTETATKVNEAVARDPKLVIWQKGRSKTKPIYDNAFRKTFGGTKLHHGAYCSDAAYRACEYTVGMHGGVHADLKHCNYLLNWGWNITGGGGNKFCWLTWTQQYLEARERGMKVVTVDPYLRQAAHHTDEWLPIKPGTDLVFFNALADLT
jgi:anaerobic selenocysteine-containing dehydrogenase